MDDGSYMLRIDEFWQRQSTVMGIGNSVNIYLNPNISFMLFGLNL